MASAIFGCAACESTLAVRPERLCSSAPSRPSTTDPASPAALANASTPAIFSLIAAISSGVAPCRARADACDPWFRSRRSWRSAPQARHSRPHRPIRPPASARRHRPSPDRAPGKGRRPVPEIAGTLPAPAFRPSISDLSAAISASKPPERPAQPNRRSPESRECRRTAAARRRPARRCRRQVPQSGPIRATGGTVAATGGSGCAAGRGSSCALAAECFSSRPASAHRRMSRSARRRASAGASLRGWVGDGFDLRFRRFGRADVFLRRHPAPVPWQ